MPDLSEILLNCSVGIAANDAGAANHIFSWLEFEYSQNVSASKNLNIFLTGPAKTLYKNFKLPSIETTDSLNTLVMKSDVVLCGSGWASDTEYNAIKLSKEANVRSVAVLDHWINYKERFIRQGFSVLPDELWVTDAYSLTLAKKLFPRTDIIMKENLYLENSAKRILKEPKYWDQENILYLMEPIRSSWNNGNLPGEFQAFEYFMRKIPYFEKSNSLNILIRPHPSEKPEKYTDWLKIKKFKGVRIDVDTSLIDLISWSNIVVGCQTYAMVIALFAGRRVYSSLPPWAPSCVLPYPQIKRIESIPSINR